MDQIEDAIETAYKDQIASLYKALSESILAANGQEAEISSAEETFKRGLAFAADVRMRALAAANP